MTARGWTAVRTVLVLIVVAGLAIDAYVHLDLASTYDVVKTSTLSQGDLFRVEAALAIVAGVALLVRPRRYTALFAFLVSAGGVVDVGKVGPIPNMYEPYWYGEKTLSLVAEAVAAVAAAALFVAMQVRARETAKPAPVTTPTPA
jgi:hypothetical protein